MSRRDEEYKKEFIAYYEDNKDKGLDDITICNKFDKLNPYSYLSSTDYTKFINEYKKDLYKKSLIQLSAFDIPSEDVSFLKNDEFLETIRIYKKDFLDIIETINNMKRKDFTDKNSSSFIEIKNILVRIFNFNNREILEVPEEIRHTASDLTSYDKLTKLKFKYAYSSFRFNSIKEDKYNFRRYNKKSSTDKLIKSYEKEGINITDKYFLPYKCINRLESLMNKLIIYFYTGLSMNDCIINTAKSMSGDIIYLYKLVTRYITKGLNIGNDIGEETFKEIIYDMENTGYIVGIRDIVILILNEISYIEGWLTEDE